MTGVVPVGEVLSLEYGKPLPKERRDEAGKYPAFGANGIKCRTNDYYRDGPGIIVGRKGSAGEVTLSPGPFWPLDVTYFVEFDRGRHDLKYLYHGLQWLNLPTLANGVKPGINRNVVYEQRIRVPPSPNRSASSRFWTRHSRGSIRQSPTPRRLWRESARFGRPFSQWELPAD